MIVLNTKKCLETLILLVQGMCDGTESARTVNDTLKSKSRRRVSHLTKKIVASNQQWKCKNCENIVESDVQPYCKGCSHIERFDVKMIKQENK